MKLRPDDPDARDGLSTSLNNIASAIPTTADHRAEKLALFRRAAEEKEVAYRLRPNDPDTARGVVVLTRNVATSAQALGRADEAVTAYRRVAEVLDRRARDNPDVPGTAAEMVTGYRALAACLRELGWLDEAARVVRQGRDRAAEMTDDASGYFQALVLFHLEGLAVAEARGKTSADARAEAEECAAAAMAALRNVALTSGQRLRDWARGQKLLGPVRGRADFKDLLNRAEALYQADTTRARDARASPEEKLAACREIVSGLEGLTGPRRLRHVGDQYARVGLLDRAATHYRRAFAVHPPAEDVSWSRLADLLVATGDLEGYRPLRQQAQRRLDRPGTAYAFPLLHVVNLAPGARIDPARLAKFVQTGADGQPVKDWKFWWAAVAYYRHGRFDEALQPFRRALYLWVQNGLWHEYADGLAAIDRRAPLDAWHSASRLRALLAAGRDDDYRRHFAEMVRRFDRADGQDVTVELPCACFLPPQKSPDRDRWVKVVEKRAAKEPKAAYLHYWLGQAYFRAGRFAEAETAPAVVGPSGGFPDRPPRGAGAGLRQGPRAGCERAGAAGPGPGAAGPLGEGRSLHPAGRGPPRPAAAVDRPRPAAGRAGPVGRGGEGLCQGRRAGPQEPAGLEGARPGLRRAGQVGRGRGRLCKSSRAGPRAEAGISAVPVVVRPRRS